MEISAAFSVLVLILPVARLKDERVEACKEAAYKVLVEIAFVRMLLVNRVRLNKVVREPVVELIFSAVIEYVEIVDVVKLTVEISVL